MGRDSLRLLLLAGVVAFAVLYGMDLSSRGINRVYGPLEQPVQTPQAREIDEEGWTLPPRQAESRQPAAQDRYVVIPRPDSAPLIDRISGAAAETLHGISSGGIRFIVSLFDKVTGS